MHAACWTAAPQAVADTTKRLEITALLTAAFRAIITTTPADLLPAVYMCVNRVAPSHSGIELGVGEATLIKVHARHMGVMDGCDLRVCTACTAVHMGSAVSCGDFLLDDHDDDDDIVTATV